MELSRVRQKKESVFRVTGLKILGRVGTHFFFLEKNLILCLFQNSKNYILGKNIILCTLKSISSLKMHKIIFFFPENLKKNSRFHQ